MVLRMMRYQKDPRRSECLFLLGLAVEADLLREEGDM